MHAQLQERRLLLLLLLLTMLSLLSAMHAAPSARSQCWADEQCDGESVIVSCNNVASNSPSSLSSACYCQSSIVYRCVDLCQSGDRDVDSQICAAVCPAYFRCTSGEAVNTIEFAAVESPESGTSLEPPTPMRTDAWWAATLVVVVVPIAVWLAIHFLQRKKRIVEPHQESQDMIATELREILSDSASSGDADISPDSEALMNVETVV